MTHGGTTNWRTRAESEAANSPDSPHSPCQQGESGRIRENENAILPGATACQISNLRYKRENRENSSQLYMCAGATRVNTILNTAGAPPESPNPPSASLWTALVNKEDIYAIAYRLALPSTDSVNAWRMAALRITRSEAFIQTVPQDVPLTRDDWERWKAMEASPRKLLSLLRKLIYGVQIWD